MKSRPGGDVVLTNRELDTGAAGVPAAPSPDTSARDLHTREDVEALLRCFYGRAFHDDVLAEPFADLCSRGLDEHLPVMCDFWETVLFRAGLYRRNALHAHRRLHQQTPLATEHFVRWLTLWNSTIDQIYQGPVAEHAKDSSGQDRHRYASSPRRHPRPAPRRSGEPKLELANRLRDNDITRASSAVGIA